MDRGVVRATPRAALMLTIWLLSACGTTPSANGPANNRSVSTNTSSTRHVPVPPSPELAVQASEPTPYAEPLSRVGNHSPYRVAGQTYTLLASNTGYVERGQASWYGPNFHGKLTSNQEVFDQHKLTAAHKTLPLPSYVQVTNLDNNRQVIVRVNDRGPFKPGRIIDLSYAAALKLGIVEQGIGNVEVRTIDSSAGAPRPAVETARNIYLQLGAFSSRDNALAALRELPQEGAHVASGDSNGKTFHRLRIGPLDSAEQAEQLKSEMSARGFPGSRIVFE